MARVLDSHPSNTLPWVGQCHPSSPHTPLNAATALVLEKVFLLLWKEDQATPCWHL